MTHVFSGALAPRRTVAALLLAGAALLVFAAPQAAEAKGKKTDLRAMSLNLYFGADVEGALVAPNTPALEAAAGAAYAQILASNPNGRLKSQAKIIKKQKPDVIGLQEAANLFTGPKDDSAAAANKLFDFIALLRKQLKKRGVPYKLAVKQQNIDVEVPTNMGIDVRLVDYDALLVKKSKKIKVQKKGGDNFETALSVPIPLDAATPTIVQRGYVWADLKVRGKKVRVANTHFEAFLGNTIRGPQAIEFVKKGGPTDSKRPTIVLGDLNSGPKTDTPEAYDTVIAAGFKNRGQKKFTCCYDSDLAGGSLSSLIDFTLGSKGVKKVSSKRTGTKTPWPSDHVGVISKLWIKG